MKTEIGRLTLKVLVASAIAITCNFTGSRNHYLMAQEVTDEPFDGDFDLGPDEGEDDSTSNVPPMPEDNGSPPPPPPPPAPKPAGLNSAQPGEVPKLKTMDSTTAESSTEVNEKAASQPVAQPPPPPNKPSKKAEAQKVAKPSDKKSKIVKAGIHKPKKACPMRGEAIEASDNIVGKVAKGRGIWVEPYNKDWVKVYRIDKSQAFVQGSCF